MVSPELSWPVSIPTTLTLMDPAAMVRVRVWPTRAPVMRATAGPSTTGGAAVLASGAVSAAVNQRPALSR
jgi:hypothetical protein